VSEINFIACNDELEELRNYSKNVITKKSFNNICYPSISLVKSEDYKEYNIKKKYVYSLDYRWQRESVEVLLDYFDRNMKKTDEIEFWSIWLNNRDDYSDLYKKKVLIQQLGYEYLDQFYENEKDVKCLQIRNAFY